MLELEEQVLDRLYHAPVDILSDVSLIQGLEATKATAGMPWGAHPSTFSRN